MTPGRMKRCFASSPPTTVHAHADSWPARFFILSRGCTAGFSSLKPSSAAGSETGLMDLASGGTGNGRAASIRVRGLVVRVELVHAATDETGILGLAQRR